MGIRETINRKPVTSAIVAGVVLILAGALIIWHYLPSQKRVILAQQFYTDDDGQTLFVDADDQLPPFDHKGREAVLARVYRCSGGRQFVGYLEKFSPKGKELVQYVRDNHRLKAGVGNSMQGATAADLLIKKPGDHDWVSATDPAAMSIRSVHCPDGSSEVEQVLP